MNDRGNAATASAATSAAENADTSALASARRRRIPWRSLLLGLVSFTAALSVSWLLNSRAARDPGATRHGARHAGSDEGHRQPIEDGIADLSPLEALRRGDDYYRAGDFVRANRIYQQLLEQANVAAIELIRLRAAKCVAHLGDPRQSAVEYRRIVEQGRDEVAVSAARYELLREAVGQGDWHAADAALRTLSVNDRSPYSRLGPRAAFLAGCVAYFADSSGQVNLFSDEELASPDAASFLALTDELPDVPNATSEAKRVEPNIPQQMEAGDEGEQTVREPALSELSFAAAHHPRPAAAAIAALLLANRQFASGDVAGTLAAYGALGEQRLPKPMRALACFNRAKLAMLRRQNQEAQRLFYRVLDTVPGDRLAAAALVCIGRMALEADAPSLALTPLRRALATSHDEQCQAAAVFVLVAAQRALCDHAGVEATVSEHRQAIARGPFRDSTALVLSLARLESSPQEFVQKSAGKRLIELLAAYQPHQSLGCLGYEHQADAYERLGLAHKAIESLHRALQHGVRGGAAERLEYRLARAHVESADATRGLEMMRGLSRRPDSTWALKAELFLAEQDLRRGAEDECLAASRALLAHAHDEAVKAEALSLMGRVFQRRGEHETAALCFAGLAPPAEGGASP